MRQDVRIVRAGSFVKLAVAGLLASLAAACSADTQRFVANPFSDPFRDPVMTGSIMPSSTQGPAPAPYQAQANAPYPGPAVYNSPGIQASALQSPSLSAPSAQPSSLRPIANATSPISGSSAGWTAQGGTPIVVGRGDTLQNLSSRYGIPPTAIMAANRLSSPNQIVPGSRLVLPVYSPGGTRVASAGQPQVLSAPSMAPAQSAAPTSHTTYRFERGPSADNHRDPAHVAAKAHEKVAHKVETRREEIKRQEARREDVKQQVSEAKAVTKSVTKPAPVVHEEAKVEQKPASEPVRVASVEPQPAPAQEQAKTAIDSFRWPVRGRIIAGFGGKTGNEGINIAVPEGTPVKAAEAGVVAYAGSELKGYGKLVLIRHDNGYVSAYANNSDIMVKRGDKVTRGEVIAKSGQTGNVASPQLHFELRKGSKPVDPVTLLAGG